MLLCWLVECADFPVYTRDEGRSNARTKVSVFVSIFHYFFRRFVSCFFFIVIPCMRCVVPQSSVWQRSNHMLHDMTLRLYFRYILKFSCNFPCFVADHRFSFPSLLPREFSDVYAMCQECRLIECSIYFDGFEMDFFLRLCCYVNVLWLARGSRSRWRRAQILIQSEIFWLKSSFFSPIMDGFFLFGFFIHWSVFCWEF